MREYGKTENLFKRNPQKKSELLVGTFTRPEFGFISHWDVTEKVDGTNVRLVFSQDGGHWYGGRSDSAQFTQSQSDFMAALLGNTATAAESILNSFNLNGMTLYGELYGPKIQAGGNYSGELGFRLFDILVNSDPLSGDRGTWLGPDAVKANAETLGVDTVPSMGIMTTDEIFELVKTGFVSTFARNRDYLAEGIVATTPVPMYNQQGSRIKFKLKTKDLN